MKLVLKLDEIKNESMRFKIEIDGQIHQACVNSMRELKENWLHPTDIYSVADASVEHNYGVLMSIDAYTKLKNNPYCSLLDVALREISEIYEKHVVKRERTAKREKIGIRIDNTTGFDWAYLYTTKDLSGAICF